MLAIDREVMTMRTDEEIKFRLSSEEKEVIAWAAENEGTTITQFVRAPAIERARALRAAAEFRQYSMVPAKFFDELQAALASPVEPVPALAAAAARLRDRTDLDPDLG
jgi:uncharacterized protein (DUF1778 family)